MLVRPTQVMWPCTCSSRPSSTGCRKLTLSTVTVTAGRRAWRAAMMPPHSSHSLRMTPPWTLPRLLECSGWANMVSVSADSAALRASRLEEPPFCSFIVFLCIAYSNF